MSVAKYFVIINDQHGGAMPMVSDEYGTQLTLFEKFDEADEAGSNNLMGRACGYEIHSLGGCCDGSDIG